STMKLHRLALTAVLFAAGMSCPAAADLSQVDRNLQKEPAYRTKPKYCLLVFGPEAKTRVWLVLDGDVLYIDRNGNGDLTEAGERARANAEETFLIGKIEEVESRVCHNLELRRIEKDQGKGKETL